MAASSVSPSVWQRSWSYYTVVQWTNIFNPGLIDLMYFLGKERKSFVIFINREETEGPYGPNGKKWALKNWGNKESWEDDMPLS